MWKILTKTEALNYINTLDDSVVVEITKKQLKNIRTTLQVRYYFGVVVKIIWDFHWLVPIAVNEMLKTTFWVETFTDLDTKEFIFVMDSIRDMWKEKYWVIIPKPSGWAEEMSLFNNN